MMEEKKMFKAQKSEIPSTFSLNETTESEGQPLRYTEVYNYSSSLGCSQAETQDSV